MRSSESRYGETTSEEPGQREQLVLRADEDAHAFAAARRGRAGASSPPCVSRSSNRCRSARGLPGAVTSSRRLARPRTISRARLAAVGARPGSEARLDQLLRSVSSSALVGCRALEVGPGLGERAAAEMGIEVVGASWQRRGGRARRQRRSGGSRQSRLRRPGRPARRRLEMDELDVLQRQIGLAGKHDAGAARQARQHLARFGEQRSTVRR